MMEEYNINQTTLRILGLYTSDYKSSLHVREIARETRVDVKAIQLQLRKLESINVLSSIEKGRNKDYRLNLDNPITKYYLILAETFASIIYLASNFLMKKLVREVVDRIGGTVLVFGSFARGEVTKQSDVDLFVLGERRLGNPVKNSIQEAGGLIGRQISVKTADTAKFSEGLEDGDPLMAEVVSNHIVLKGVDSFCEIMWRHYARR